MPVTEKSEFQCVVVRLGALEKHPNADSLSITSVNGYPVVVRTEDYKEGDLAVYVSVDAVVPTNTPQFEFLGTPGKTEARIKARRLRGVFSMGLLIPASECWLVGDDVSTLLGVTKYESPHDRRLAQQEAQKQKYANARLAKNTPTLPVYGLDSMRKYGSTMKDGEVVVVTEKIHGCNARYVFHHGRLWVGSHRVMRGASRSRFAEVVERAKLKLFGLLGIRHRAHTLSAAGDIWWQIAEQYNLKEKLATRPGYVLYGEIYGQDVQDLTYDSPKGRKFLAFDVYDMATGQFLNYYDFLVFAKDIGIDVVPQLYLGPWTATVKEAFLHHANTGRSVLNPNQLVEGIVVKPVAERTDPACGRVALKYVGEGYQLRGDTEPKTAPKPKKERKPEWVAAPA